MQDKKVIEVNHLNKKFGDNEILKDINGTVKSGEVICVIGPSGAGKSTFLRCLNLLEKPTAGEVKFDGTDLTHVDEKQLINLRERMGMVFKALTCFPI